MTLPTSSASPRVRVRKVVQSSAQPVESTDYKVSDEASDAPPEQVSKLGGEDSEAAPLAALTEAWRATLAKQALPSAVIETAHLWQVLQYTKLKQFDSAASSQTNAMLSLRLKGGWSDGDAAFEWRVVEPTPINLPVVVTLAHNGKVVPGWRITLSEKSNLLPWLPQPFASLSETAKHLCLTVALEPLLSSLSRTISLPTEVAGLAGVSNESAAGESAKASAADTSNKSELSTLSLHVTAVREKGQGSLRHELNVAADDTVELSLPADVLQAIYVAKARKRDLAGVQSMLLDIPVCTAVASLPLDGLRRLQLGDVVLFDGDASFVDELPLYLCAGDTAITLLKRQGGHGEFVVNGSFPLKSLNYQSEGAPMNQAQSADTSESSFAPTVDSAIPLAELKSIPVTLQFEIGRLTLTVDELSQLSAGNVIKLPTKLGTDTVAITAKGRTFAVGEIVHIDDQLGVKITSIANSALS
jgi:type III secretion system YscQ/HrcQ family protein